MAKKTGDLAADGVHAGTLLKNEVQYRAPIFQRHYVWTEKQFQTLWQDVGMLLEVGGEVESRFLGAIVFEDQGGSLATDPEEFLIVDGQQRLLTLLLLLVAIADQSDSIGTPESRTFASQLTKLWIVNQSTRIAEEPKVLPTLADYAQFVAVMAALKRFGTVKLPTPFGPPTGHLTRMYRLISKTVREGVGAVAPPSGEANTPDETASAKLAYLDTLASAVLNKLKFVEIVLGSDDDPHHVFDRLNDAGIKLDVADLIRNDVFLRLASEPKTAQTLHDQEWTPFESSLNGSLSDFVFPYALLKKSSTTKGQMIADLRAVWKGWDASAIIDDLDDHVPAYMAISTGSVRAGLLPKGSLGLEAQIKRLARMPAPTSIYPYAMMLIRSAADESLAPTDAERCLLTVESFLVRRAFNGLEPTGLHALFKGMWAAVGGDAKKLVAEIDKKPTIKYPSDLVFANDIRTQALYDKRIDGYVVDEYDRSLPGDPATVKPTVDHVMPQKLGPGWSVAPTDHERLLHVWANLVPLSGPGNSGKGQLPWAQIRQALLAETSFKTPRKLAMAHKTWGPKEIEARSNELVTWALLRWPRS